MGFKKPFRTMPIRPARRCRLGELRGRNSHTVSVLARAAAFGLVLAVGSFVVERPARSLWRSGAEDHVATAAREGSVFYSGCDTVRRAGAAPLYAGEPGYRIEMDGDSDGIACEPYRYGR